MRLRRRLLIGGVVALVAVYLTNASWLASPAGPLTILAHRGPHQTFSNEGLTNATCTATRIDPPTHRYIENSLPSIAAAFAFGADVVELDVHPTTDGQFAVFHDWTLDCRTEGKGVTREHSLAELKKLDIGYGYTADGGKSFPLRGHGVGLLPSLDEVLRAHPDRRFVINIKSNDPEEGRQLAAWFKARPEIRTRGLIFFGSERPIRTLLAAYPRVKVSTKAQFKRCALRYMLLGWSGHVPAACHDTLIAVPVNARHAVWGWPNRFLDRMQKAGSDVFVAGPVDFKLMGVRGLDEPADLRKLPDGWRGGVMTDRIEIIGPALKRARGNRPPL